MTSADLHSGSGTWRIRKGRTLWRAEPTTRCTARLSSTAARSSKGPRSYRYAHARTHTLFLLSPLNTAVSAGDPQQTEKRRGGGLAPPRPGVPPLRSPRHHHGHRHLPDHAGLHCHLVQRRHRQSLEMRAPDDITAHARREACVYGHTLLFPMNTVTSSSRDVVQTGSEMLCCRL